MKTAIRILLSMLVFLFALGTGVAFFITLSPQFGKEPEGERLARIRASDHYRDGKFINLIETRLDMSVGTMFRSLKEMMTAKGVVPSAPLPVAFGVEERVAGADTSLFVTWYGHSALLVEMQGKRILLDPMLGPVASPVPFFGKRFAYREPIDINAFSDIDAVILSHDHYDHLDHRSILALKGHVRAFFVPLGVGSHLQAWGVPASRITELDWWESISFDGLELTAAPARHFSGRGLTDGNKTLWASWVLKSETHKIYFSGDSGYGPHFKTIGELHGPFDFTMIECGQYNEKWEAIHMMPEQSARAHLDLRGRVMMPIHWGAFPLSTHPWQEPVERLLAATNAHGIMVAHPLIGERFEPIRKIPTGQWWKMSDEAIVHGNPRP